MSGSTKTDAADEAGGETIFSSDGMAPLPVPKVPVIASSNSFFDNSAILDTDTSLVDPSTSTASIGAESPQDRLVRLQKEVQQLSRELPNNQDVMKLAQTLSTRLLQTSTNNAADELVRVLINQKRQEQEDAPGAKEGIVYELYGGSAPAPTSSMEERLLQMERLVGSTTTTTTESLVQRMEYAENLVKRVDAKALDEAATRAKIIRADLEAASKARSKLASASGSAAAAAAETKTITALHDEMMQLQGISQHLPALVQRLQSLAHVHVQSAHFSSRLTSAEQELQTMTTSVSNLQECLNKVEDSMLENMATMQDNMKLLVVIDKK